MKTLIVTNDHLKLLQNFCIDWNNIEFGAPSIDPKRPYGNSNVYYDICNILGWEYNEEEDLSDELYAKCNKIHSEMEFVLQILCQNLSIKIGTYVLSTFDYSTYIKINDENL